MSGGTFNYIQLEFLAEAIIDETKMHGDTELRKHARKVVNKLLKLRKEIKAIDYFLAGDTIDWRVK
jgi:hypothetical protein